MGFRRWGGRRWWWVGEGMGLRCSGDPEPLPFLLSRRATLVRQDGRLESQSDLLAQVCYLSYGIVRGNKGAVHLNVYLL